MTTMICTARPKVKATRKTARPAASFGAGLARFVPLAVLAEGFAPPSEADERWAAEHLNSEPQPNFDLLAGESAAIDAMSALSPPPSVDRCVSCGDLAEAPTFGLCPDCLDDAATDAAIACQNRRAMGQYRVF